MSASSSSMESIAASLATIAGACTTLHNLLDKVRVDAPDDTATADTEGKPAAKKVAAKRTASKKVAAKKTKADDLSDVTNFKKRLFDIAEASGVDDVMPKLKAFIKAQGHGSSDEIEVDDRADFLVAAKEHFAELAGEGADEEEDDGLGF